MIFRHRVKEYRLQKGWSQQKLADHLKVSRQTIISIESYRYNPSLELGMRLSMALEAPMEVLFYFEFHSAITHD
ncbi:MAG: helix-turn-helix transcriptional regulator [Bacteroidetes bacterium]|jgi:putative transcriptional regulator|nr:helix-turn-helix transcriptional regulator [Bacteroidota bacterium]MDA0864740.1 helix-turn-helix transcriptional regulator [Bacteroidota bacterium]HCK06050.1 transcriptional regulator [Flavobacteriaceae bacterium]